MFDRVMAGWDVLVLVDDTADTRPLEILGVRVESLQKSLASKVRHPLPQALALDTELYTSDQRIREGLLKLLEQDVIDEVALWGTQRPCEADLQLAAMQHQLSLAARAFKAQALTAVAVPVDAAGTCEMFRTREFHPCDNGFRDLVPAGL